MNELRKIKNHPTENPFDFTEYVDRQKEEDEIHSGLFFELAENKMIYNQIPVSILIKDMEKNKNLFTNGVFILSD